MNDSSVMWLAAFVLLLGALSVSSFVEWRSKGQSQTGQAYFALLYMCGAIALIVYKMKTP